MKTKSITKKRLAELMHTSRAQIDRILDPEKGNVTIETLQRAAPLRERRQAFVRHLDRAENAGLGGFLGFGVDQLLVELGELLDQ